jgi:pyrroloquinoline-quinone synthase
MDLTLRYCDTRALQEEAVRALFTKCDILAAVLDAIMAGYGAGADTRPSAAPGANHA